MGLEPRHSVAEAVEGLPRLVQETKAGTGESCCVMTAAVYLKMVWVCLVSFIADNLSQLLALQGDNVCHLIAADAHAQRITIILSGAKESGRRL